MERGYQFHSHIGRGAVRQNGPFYALGLLYSIGFEQFRLPYCLRVHRRDCGRWRLRLRRTSPQAESLARGDVPPALGLRERNLGMTQVPRVR